MGNTNAEKCRKMQMDFPPSLFLLLKQLKILRFVGVPTKVSDPRISLYHYFHKVGKMLYSAS